MREKVLIIVHDVEFLGSKGTLNTEISKEMQKQLETLGYSVSLTSLKDGYDINEEINKILDANILIFQYPIFWFNVPWSLKKYCDEVFTTSNKLFNGDGRSRNDPSKKYGSGGLLADKKYMLSVTWNAPSSAFEKGNFLECGLDESLISMHKALQFLGCKPLASFQINDVYKNPEPQKWFENLKNHINQSFK